MLSAFNILPSLYSKILLCVSEEGCFFILYSCMGIFFKISRHFHTGSGHLVEISTAFPIGTGYNGITGFQRKHAEEIG